MSPLWKQRWMAVLGWPVWLGHWTARLLLGLFILWQLFYLGAENLLGMLEELRTESPKQVGEILDEYVPEWRKGEGTFYEATSKLNKITTAWGQMTAQSQGWSLFAPNVASEIPFPALELRWEEEVDPWLVVRLTDMLARTDPLLRLALKVGEQQKPPPLPRAPEWLLSPNEPADPHNFLRWSHFRLRRFEGNLGVVMTRYTDESEDETHHRWRKNIEQELRTDWDATLAYMKWRLADFQRQHPEAPPPTQVIMHIRRYHIYGPDSEEAWNWYGPTAEPFARWFPQEEPPSGMIPVQMFDPEQQEFVWLKSR